MLPLRTFTAHPSRFSLLSMLVGEGGLDVRTDVAYGPHARHRLDVYQPKQDTGSGPVALFLYGGSWRGGCRSCYGFVGAALAAHGIPTAVSDYRLFPEVRWPLFQEDAAAAFRWVRRELGGHGQRPVVVIGHSAGAHMAALLAHDPRWLGAERPVALVGLSGPYSFQPTEWPTTREIFAMAQSRDEPRPLSHAGTHSPPSLLIHGAADITVKQFNLDEFAAVLRGHGTPVETLLLPEADHKATVLGFARPLRRRHGVLEPTLAFLRRLPVGPQIRSAGSAASASRLAG
ncbi:MAG: alpha/beta hydrolase [Hyphomicrobiaceae bacterium]